MLQRHVDVIESDIDSKRMTCVDVRCARLAYQCMKRWGGILNLGKILGAAVEEEDLGIYLV